MVRQETQHGAVFEPRHHTGDNHSDDVGELRAVVDHRKVRDGHSSHQRGRGADMTRRNITYIS